jgi:DNA polymerase-3 subunit alpha
MKHIKIFNLDPKAITKKSLETLNILDGVLSKLKKNGIDIDINNIPLDDTDTMKSFQKGDTDDIFLFDSQGMKRFLRKVKPDCFSDIVAVSALNRPGPFGAGITESFIRRKWKKEPVQYLFPELENILNDTYGMIIFKEQLVYIATKIAGFSIRKSNKMRKALSTKHADKIAYFEQEFLKKGIKKGYQEHKLKDLFSFMNEYAGYVFSKSHSTSLTHFAFQVAFLKIHYRDQFKNAFNEEILKRKAEHNKKI